VCAFVKAKPEAPADIRRDEPRVPVEFHHAQLVAVEGQGGLVLLQKSEAG
jgi:hypothetical protein